MDASARHGQSGVLVAPLTLTKPPRASLGLASTTASWPPAADYTRHVRTTRSTGSGAATGCATTTIVFSTLEMLALVAHGVVGLDVIDAVLAVLVGVLFVAYYLLLRGVWDVWETAPARPLLVVPWAVGFVADQGVGGLPAAVRSRGDRTVR